MLVPKLVTTLRDSTRQQSAADVAVLVTSFLLTVLEETPSQVAWRRQVFVVRLRSVSLLDATGLRALRDVVRRSRGTPNRTAETSRWRAAAG